MAKMLTIGQFMQSYGVSRSTVYRLFEQGNLSRVNVGRSVRIKTDDAEKWFASLTDEGEHYGSA